MCSQMTEYHVELSKVLDVYENLTNLILIQFPKTQYLTSSPPALVLVFVRGLGLERFLFAVQNFCLWNLILK